MTEDDILHETANLYLCRVRGGLEIRLNAQSYSIFLGSPTQGVERAKLTMARLENGIKELRRLYQLPTPRP